MPPSALVRPTSFADKLIHGDNLLALKALEQEYTMLEPKASNHMTAEDVLAKRDVAVEWCHNASAYTHAHNGKPWQYALIPHDAIAENMTLGGLIRP